METSTHSPRFLKKRKFFVVLPLLVLPFLTIAFWFLGGGKASNLNERQQAASGGLNVKLPDAHFKDEKSLNKLSYYELADSDSAKLDRSINAQQFNSLINLEAKELLHSENDSVWSLIKDKSNSQAANPIYKSSFNNRTYTHPNEAKVYRKLDELNSALNEGTNPQNTVPSTGRPKSSNASGNTDDIDRLEQMITMAGRDIGGEDPEMKQLNGMMEKILDIQHPERVKEQIRQKSETHKEQVFAVTTSSKSDYTSLLSNDRTTDINNDSSRDREKPSINGFYSLYSHSYNYVGHQNAIQAVIHESQSLVDGSIVKLRLLKAVYINDTQIPRDNFVYGTASLNGERLIIQIKSIRFKNSIFPVQLSVFDLDGIIGIHIPGAITRDVAKGSTDQAIQGIDFNNLNPSISAQAADAGIEAAKTLLSKKAKLIKVYVKAGYQVLLQDGKQNASF